MVNFSIMLLCIFNNFFKFRFMVCWNTMPAGTYNVFFYIS